MKKPIIYLLFLVIVGCSDNQQTTHEALANTTWTHSIYKECIDSLIFISETEYYEYACEVDDHTYGTYKISGNDLILNPMGFWFPSRSEKLSFEEIGDGVEWMEGSGSLRGNEVHFKIKADGIYYIKRTGNGETVWEPQEDWVYKRID